MIPALEDLRVVETEGLVLHEAHDEDRLERLKDIVSAEGVQRNPVIVAPLATAVPPDDLADAPASARPARFLVLDGAHRVRGLAELGCRMVLAQVVEPPEKAESWAHAIPAPDLSVLEGSAELELLGGARDGAVAVLESRDGVVASARARGEGLAAEVRALWALQGLYPGGVVRRVAAETPVSLAEGEALVRYRAFTSGELVEVVGCGAVLPAGITRFRVRERVLGVRFPLEKLLSGELEERNRELAAFVKERWSENRVRYYGEPVVLFE